MKKLKGEGNFSSYFDNGDVVLHLFAKEDVMIQLVQDFKIDDFINKFIDIITKIKSLHVMRRC